MCKQMLALMLSSRHAHSTLTYCSRTWPRAGAIVVIEFGPLKFRESDCVIAGQKDILPLQPSLVAGLESENDRKWIAFDLLDIPGPLAPTLVPWWYWWGSDGLLSLHPTLPPSWLSGSRVSPAAVASFSPPSGVDDQFTVVTERPTEPGFRDHPRCKSARS